MTKTNFTWPTVDDYDLAMQDRVRAALDKDLKRGKLDEDSMGIKRYGGANLYACLYRIDDWMIRCFCRANKRKPPDDITDRYREISKFCLDSSNEASPLLPVTYVERGLSVDYIDPDTSAVERTEIVPIVKMPFIEDPSLGAFVEHNHQKQAIMERLADAWLRMIRELERIKMAHGDLDLTNVKVREQGGTLTLKLIDYDNVWIPSLSGRPQTEFGHAPFQHPEFIKSHQRPYDATMDRFSALVMYISLKALAVRPQLYKAWGADDVDHLLLSKADYENEIQQVSGSGYYTRRIPQLKNEVPALTPCIDELSAALHNRSIPESLNTILLAPTHRVQTQEQPSIALGTEKIGIYDFKNRELMQTQSWSGTLPPTQAAQPPYYSPHYYGSGQQPPPPPPSTQQQSVAPTPPSSPAKSGRYVASWIIGIVLVIIALMIFFALINPH
jgi:hypothetical protein